MGWLLRDERNMRRHRPPAQHHEPPLGWSARRINKVEIITGINPSIDVEYEYISLCGDCGWTPEGEFEKCDAHKEEDDE